MHASVACCLSALIIASLIRFAHARRHDAWSMHGPSRAGRPVDTHGIRAGMDHAWIIRTTYYVRTHVTQQQQQHVRWTRKIRTYLRTTICHWAGSNSTRLVLRASERAWPPSTHRNAVTQRSRSHDGPCMANLAGAHYESEYEQFPL